MKTALQRTGILRTLRVARADSARTYGRSVGASHYRSQWQMRAAWAHVARCLMKPAEIVAWANEVRGESNRRFQINLWIPDPPPKRDAEHEHKVREFLSGWGSVLPPDAGDATPPDFSSQCEALLQASPPIVSSVMGLYPPEFVSRLKQRGIAMVCQRLDRG